ncbi:MAG: ASKHA domain-containing protein [Sphaerochaetaceae bacterium]
MEIKQNLTVITLDEDHNLSFYDSQTILEVLRSNNIKIVAPCGGNGICGKCLIKVIDGRVSPPLAEEKKILGDERIREGYRLACRATLSEQNSVTISLIKEEQVAQIVSTFNPFDDNFRINFSSTANRTKDVSYKCGIDVGTTTIVVYLVKFSNNTFEVLGNISALNAQRPYGQDVISRIQYTQENEKGLEVLQRVLVNQLNQMISTLLTDYNVNHKELKEVVVVGNPTITHLFLKAPVVQIALAPYKLYYEKEQRRSAKELSFKNLDGETTFIVPGNISAYVGSDITVGMYSVEINKKEENVLFLDIGTNGEIALFANGNLYSCSAAAGPAFEGASITFGMGAIKGAIDHVWITEEENQKKVNYSVIGESEAKGICGSAIIDTVSIMLELEQIDETGAMDEQNGFISDYNNSKAFKICDKIYFTNGDVREVQLAKAAIAAGVEILLKEAGIDTFQLDKVILAGGFGSYIKIESAQRIGLLPNIDSKKIVSLGNCAGRGALLSLLGEEHLKKIDNLRKESKYIELSSLPAFQQRFVDAMIFD